MKIKESLFWCVFVLVAALFTNFTDLDGFSIGMFVVAMSILGVVWAKEGYGFSRWTWPVITTSGAGVSWLTGLVCSNPSEQIIAYLVVINFFFVPIALCADGFDLEKDRYIERFPTSA